MPLMCRTNQRLRHEICCVVITGQVSDIDESSVHVLFDGVEVEGDVLGC